ncbi:MAG: hypothetical protein WBO55_13190, partial [Rhizobiaceae bacterium]
REGFEIDRAAMRFTSPAIPVPEIVEIGAAFDRHFAISRRHYGRFIEEAPASDSAAVTQTLATLLRALRTHQVWPDDDQYVTRDFFRFDEQGKIVEHWDAMQQIPKTTANGNTMY